MLDNCSVRNVIQFFFILCHLSIWQHFAPFFSLPVWGQGCISIRRYRVGALWAWEPGWENGMLDLGNRGLKRHLSHLFLDYMKDDPRNSHPKSSWKPTPNVLEIGVQITVIILGWESLYLKAKSCDFKHLQYF